MKLEIRGSNNKIDRTAQNESLNPMSKSEAGLATSITKAATPRVLTDELLRPVTLLTESKENIITERIIESGIPVMKANPHIIHMTISSRSHSKLRRFRKNGNKK